MTYLPLNGRPIRLTLGLRALDLATWIEVDEHRSAEMQQKLHLLRTVPGDVVAHLQDGLRGSRELWSLLSAHVLLHFPHLYRDVDYDEGHVVALTDAQTAERIDVRTMHPIDACGRLVQEDAVLMRKLEGEWRLVAASVCFPSRWSLAEKIGKGLSAIHDPVPGYESQIARPVEAMFDKITCAHPMWRLNWTLIDDPALHLPHSSARSQPSRQWARERDDADIGRLLHFRVERQTLTRLPESDDVVFTIRTYVQPLAEVGAQHPQAYADLAIALRSAEPELRTYKGWDALLPMTLEWLDGQASATADPL